MMMHCDITSCRTHVFVSRFDHPFICWFPGAASADQAVGMEGDVAHLSHGAHHRHATGAALGSAGPIAGLTSEASWTSEQFDWNNWGLTWFNSSLTWVSHTHGGFSASVVLGQVAQSLAIRAFIDLLSGLVPPLQPTKKTTTSPSAPWSRAGNHYIDPSRFARPLVDWCHVPGGFPVGSLVVCACWIHFVPDPWTGLNSYGFAKLCCTALIGNY